MQVAAVQGMNETVPASGPPRRRRRWLRWLIALPFLFLAASILQVAVLRFVNPPFSAFMAARQLQAWGDGDRAFRVAYDWRDLDRIAPSLPLSMIVPSRRSVTSPAGAIRRRH